MKRFIVGAALVVSGLTHAQSNDGLQKHYEAYYEAMKKQGDVNGIIGALTHLNVLSPSKARQDTLGYVYANENMYIQALNTVGIDRDVADSDLAVQVKAIALKALGQPKRALEQFQILYKRAPNPYLAYESADLMVQTGDKEGAMTLITYGIDNATDEMKYAFYERQQPYEVPLKAAFLHLKALAVFNNDAPSTDQAIGLIDQALAIDPNFNLASLSKQALERRKNEPAETGQAGKTGQ